MKIAAITGAGHRIGRAIAEHLLSRGYRVILHAHCSFDELSKWTSRSLFNEQVIGLIEADLSKANGQKRLCNQINKLSSHLDILINSAAIFSPLPFEQIDRSSYRRMQAINIEAPFFISQQLLPKLRQSNNASIINITDALWEHPYKAYSHYAVSKAGLAILTKSLAIELAPHIRVNAIAPGAILFPSFYDEDKKRRILDLIPQKRLGEPKEIATAVAFLAENSTITGQTLVVDGGRSLLA